jgi:NCAIR mutase (PurE)-related protein
VGCIQIGYGVNETAGETAKKNDANKNLIRRFNFHSTMILKSTMGVETNTSDVPVAEEEENVSKKVGLFTR